MKTFNLTINADAILEVMNISYGAFAPVYGFMNKHEYESVVKTARLPDGDPWTIPITLDVPECDLNELKKTSLVHLVGVNGAPIADLQIEDLYTVQYEEDIQRVYGVTDKTHPGVAKELARSPWRVGGKLTNVIKQDFFQSEYIFTPEQSKAHFKKLGWNTVTGFQTRNPIHKAHEYLQRLAMERTDGIFLQPLIGWKKKGDIRPEAVLAAYKLMCEDYYPSNRACLGVLQTPMRYCGPREAVFHAILRRNFGCTHFIIGRDHAGVGNFYGKYEAQEYSRTFSDLGIDILEFNGPYFCPKCELVVTENTCKHGEAASISVSGTDVRKMLSSKTQPPAYFMRPDVSDLLIKLNDSDQLFI